MSEIQRLRERVAELDEEVRQLKEEAGIIDKLPDYRKLKLMKLSDTGYRILIMLSKRKLVSFDAIARLLWQDGDEPENSLSVIGVQLHRLRKVLRRHEVYIENSRGLGWYFDDESRAKAAELIEEVTS